jgi:hypothetical protein
MGVKVAAFVAGIVLLTSCSHTPSAVTPAGCPAFSPAIIDQALQSDRPYVISVVGDSTSRMAGSWVYLITARIAEMYGRAVTVHDWDTESNSYASVETFGSGAPVTVWNGSGGGKSAQYSLKWYPQMAPEPADLTIINHTHNNPWHAAEGIFQLVDVAYRNTRPGGAVAVTLQNPRTDTQERADLEQVVTDQLRTAYSAPGTGVVIIDVNTSFRGGDLRVLLKPDGAHPSDEGSQLWAATVRCSLKLR